MNEPIANRLSSGYRAGGVEKLAISQTAEVSQNVLHPSLVNQIRVAETNLDNAQELIKILSALNERVFGDSVFGINPSPVPENPIMITGQLQRLHWLQYELATHLSTIRSIVNVITEV